MTAVKHVVVDGSNIATEGRSTPSLDQLESAVQELRRELPGTEVIVVVDATFAHRIDGDERPRFEEAALRGEYVYPPAGAIGRGDAFLLRIAQKIDATVLSNDSFQEFHGEHEWLFDTGRLLGATPVPGVGWIFVPRNPVRGPKSRIAVRDAERSKSKVEKAIAVATREAVEPETAKSQRKGKKKAEAAAVEEVPGRALPRAVNDPLTFISFVAEHPLGSTLEAEVENFTSHGAVVRVGEMHCYVPLSGLGNPPPRSARDVLRRDEQRTFVLTALDPQRRGVELALPEVAVVSGRPSEETVEAEVAMTRARRSHSRGTASRRKDAAVVEPQPAPAMLPDSEAATSDAVPAPSPVADGGARRSRKARAGDDEAPAAAAETPPRRPARARKAVAVEVEAPSAKKAAPSRAVAGTRAGRMTEGAPAGRTGATKKAVAAETPAAAKKAAAKKAAATKAPAAAKVPAATKRAAATAKIPAARTAAAASKLPATTAPAKRRAGAQSAAASKSATRTRQVAAPAPAKAAPATQKAAGSTKATAPARTAKQPRRAQ